MQQAESIQKSESKEVAFSMRPDISARRRRDSGAMLLAILFMMAIMVIVAMAMAPSFIQQAKRDREEEMIHRGTEYARAVKKYYKKFGRYPANLEQLENTNQIRFLRKRFKDPLTKEGDWKVLHYGDLQTMGIGIQGVAGLQGTQGGLQAANALNALSSGASASGATGGDQGANTAPQGAQLTPQQPGAGFGNQTPGNAQSGGGTSSFGATGQGAGGQSGFTLAPGVGQSSGAGGAQQGQNATGQNATGQTGTNNSIFGNSGVGGQTFGGGAIVGVASKDKDKTIRIYNKKKTYDEWVFIYSPAMDTATNTLLRGPFNGQSYGGIGGSQIGTPAGQLNQGNQSPFGQQPGVQGQQPGGFGQQNPQQNTQPNQQLTPGGQFPPDQTQPQ